MSCFSLVSDGLNKEKGDETVVVAGVSSFWLVSGGLEKEKGEGDGSEETSAWSAGAANALLAAGREGKLEAVPPEKMEEKGFGLGADGADGADGAGVGLTVSALENIEEKGLGMGEEEAGGLLAAGAAENIEAKGFAGEDVWGGFEGCWAGGCTLANGLTEDDGTGFWKTLLVLNSTSLSSDGESISTTGAGVWLNSSVTKRDSSSRVMSADLSIRWSK